MCECMREPDPGICRDEECPRGSPNGHCRCVEGHEFPTPRSTDE